MLKNRYSKIVISSFLVLLALWVATPKVYIHDLLHHNHTIVKGTGTEINTQSADDCDFENYNKPAYFSIFKFIFSFIPIKSQDKENVSLQASPLSSISHAVSLLRGPPVAE